MYFYIFLPILLIFVIFLSLKKTQEGKKFPQPPGIFFIGHAWELRSTTNILNAFSRFIRDHGNTVTLRVGPVKGLLTADYKFIEFILSGNKILTKSQNYLYLVPWLGRNGLLISDGPQWKRYRKLLTPAFHFEILKQFVDIFDSMGSILIEKFSENLDKPNIDLQQFLNLCTLDIILETAMGTKINAQRGENFDYVDSVQEMCRLITDRCLSPLKIFNSTFVFTRDFFRQRKVVRILQDFSKTVIKNRKERKNEEKNKKLALLDLLMKICEDGQSLTDEELKDQVNTFLFAGHHTTASGICFTLFCLADHPEIQSKVLEEQKSLFGDDKDPKITYQNLQEMKFLELVIKESLRLYPPVPIIGRLTKEKIEFDGYVIPRHTNIAMYIYGIHRNPDFFPDPETFDPDRFEHFDSSRPYCYIPFSAGSRNCIGMKFAMLEMKCIISKVIRQFEVVSVCSREDLVLAAETVLKSVNGVNVGLKKRF